MTTKWLSVAKMEVGTLIDCSKCGGIFAITAPLKKKRSRVCQACTTTKNREWIRANPEKAKEIWRKSREKYYGKSIKRKQNRKRSNPQQFEAHRIMKNALKRGDLIRMPCVKCDRLDTHGHHEDYSKPLDVIWLCPLHHKARHKELLA